MTTKTLSQLCYLNREVARLRQSLVELRAGMEAFCRTMEEDHV